MRFGKLLVPLLIILAAAYWRFHLLEAQSLWHDEGNSLRLAERSISELIEATRRDIHPPAYYILLKVWIALVGTSEFGLRALSALWSVLAVAASFGLGRRFFGGWGASLAAVLVAANSFAIYYGQEARMYAQLGALSLLSLCLLADLLRETVKHQLNHRRYWLAWGALVLVNTLGMYSQYTYAFTLATQGIFCLIYYVAWRRWAIWQAFLSAGALSGVFFLAWLPTAYRQITTWPTTGDTTSLTERLERIFNVLVYGYLPEDVSIGALILPLLLIGLALIPLKNNKKNIYTLVPFALVLISVGALLFSGAYRATNLKFLLPAQAATAILIGAGTSRLIGWGAGLDSVQRGVLGIVAVGLFGAILGQNVAQINRLYDAPEIARSDYRAIATLIGTHARRTDAVILNAPNQQEVFSYYYRGDAPVFPLPMGLGGDDVATQAATENILAQYRQIYLVLWGQSERDPNGIVENTLNHGAFVVGRQWFNDVELVQYAVLAPPPESPQYQSEVRFGEQIVLVGYALSGEVFKAGQGDVLGVTLFWQTDAPLDKRYKVSVQVLNEHGQFIGVAHDSEPANGQAPTIAWQVGDTVIDNHGLVIGPQVTAGNYQVVVVLYDADAPLERLSPDNGNPDRLYYLADLRVEN